MNSNSSKSKIIKLYMPKGGQDSVIIGWYGKDPKWVEFRGTPYSEWDENTNHPMQKVHDMMEGWHTTVLHQGSVLVLIPKHSDYKEVFKMITEDKYYQELKQ